MEITLFILKVSHLLMRRSRSFMDSVRFSGNEPDVITATVMIANEKLDAAEGYTEFISYTPVVEE